MLAFCRGDEDAFVTLYRSYRDRLVNHARRLLNDPVQAEDAAQEVFLKLYKSRATYQPRSRFSTYLFRIAVNHCLNVRARSEHKLVSGDAGIDQHVKDPGLEPADAVVRERLRRVLTVALGNLPDKQRAALVLCHHEGLSYAEAAEALEVSESALKSLVHRARQGMIEQLGSHIEEVAEVEHAM
jgi:RNA polymerase sigma-70 factor, ECF subfamily